MTFKKRLSRRALLKTSLALGATPRSTIRAATRGRTEFDCIVMGRGAIGSGALYWLSGRLGDRVTGSRALPGHPQVSFAVGAGMSYKFASLFSKIMSQLALDGQSEYDYSAITLARPGLIQSPYQQETGSESNSQGLSL